MSGLNLISEDLRTGSGCDCLILVLHIRAFPTKAELHYGLINSGLHSQAVGDGRRDDEPY